MQWKYINTSDPVWTHRRQLKRFFWWRAFDFQVTSLPRSVHRQFFIGSGGSLPWACRRVAPLYFRYITQVLTQYLPFERHKMLQNRDIVLKLTPMRTNGTIAPLVRFFTGTMPLCKPSVGYQKKERQFEMYPALLPLQQGKTLNVGALLLFN